MNLYKKEVVHHVVKCIEDNVSAEINILQAMRFDRKAWFSVSKTTIANCFRKSGFKLHAFDSQGNEQEQEKETTTISDDVWALAINDDNQQLQFNEYVNIDEDVMTSGELTDNDIVSAAISPIETEEEKEEEEEATVEKVSKSDAEKALWTLHKYFEFSNINDKTIFDKLFAIEELLTADCNLKLTKMTEFYK
ncbi:tigger transposable element-derived protein 6-like isoform X2 [Cotesia glomerata]|uniref:tigger transposable element-derived protein 6-like isoform X2 n=1 Tax=Cotesia glomerata TaxID=32391 RepID=UPI001D025053|nr:tigger transposable element-derived protein 6-like isoform X2 [Cotesia glomerata]